MPTEPQHNGILAAGGRFPLLVAQTLKQSGHRVSCLGVKDHADPVLRDICDDFAWTGWGKLGRAIRYFRSRGITEATMAGKFHKSAIYAPCDGDREGKSPAGKPRSSQESL